jgi:FKBP-type peptidyl-prolyl cis-trans isomerase SlyD
MIANGATVTIHYKLTVDGMLVDSSEGREPLTYTQGQGQIVPGLERHLEGLSAGARTKVKIPPEDAYGELNEDAIQTLPKSAFEESKGLEVGRMIQGRTVEGQSFSATIRRIDENNVTLDLNHPLAGRTLLFEVEILKVTDPD